MTLADLLRAPLPADVRGLIEAGRYGEARSRLAALAEGADDPATREALLFQAERLRRVALDFTLTDEQFLDAVRASLPDATDTDLARWRDAGWIQWRMIEGERRHFRRDPANLFLRCAEARARRDAVKKPSTAAKEAEDAELEAHLQSVIGEGVDGLCCPTRYRTQCTLTVHAGQVPAGETIRCWLLFPREEPHQTDIRLLATDPAEHILAPPDAPQRTVYLEQPSRGDAPTVFRASCEFTAWASHRVIDPASVRPHDPASEVVQRFTREEPPHIVFTPAIRALAAEIVGDETNPYQRARQVFDWMDREITWIGEREYATLRDIPALCLQRRAGDCGVQALLLITLCRAAGIPARWESGWYLQRHHTTMHDWARFHLKPHGWLWADPSKGHHSAFQGEAARRFYFGNIDAYRLVANSAIAQPLHPPKTHPRSETLDFQRGEVEWSGGNLYFDQWDWDFQFETIG